MTVDGIFERENQQSKETISKEEHYRIGDAVIVLTMHLVKIVIISSIKTIHITHSFNSNYLFICNILELLIKYTLISQTLNKRLNYLELLMTANCKGDI